MHGVKPVGVRTLTIAYETLAGMNPFRYRGYVWDEETRLYYLRSRYYSPLQIHFVNCDIFIGEIGTIIQHNVFSYAAIIQLPLGIMMGCFWEL